MWESPIFHGLFMKQGSDESPRKYLPCIGLSPSNYVDSNPPGELSYLLLALVYQA